MGNRGILVKLLAIAGTALAWFPILATLVTGIGGSIGRRAFHLDYLMPAELFPFALGGGGLLLAAALWARRRRGLVAGALAAAAAFLFGGQLLAVVTGLASGAAEPAGWTWTLVLASLAAYALAVVLLGVGGILLLSDLFRAPRAPAAER